MPNVTDAPLFRDVPECLGRLSQTHGPIHVRPTGEPSLAYLIPVPLGWKTALGVEMDPHKDKAHEVIGLFASEDDVSTAARIAVSVFRPPWEVDPLEWTRTGLINAGWTISVARWLDTPDARFEVGAVRTQDDGRTEVRRCTGFVDGGRIARVDAMAPLDKWQTMHDLLWPCGVVFDLDERTDQGAMESTLVHEGPLLRFSLPASWAVMHMANEDARAVRWIADIAQGAEYTAALRVDATDLVDEDNATLQGRQAWLREDLHSRGVVLARTIDRVPDDEDFGLGLSGWLGLYRCEAVDAEGEAFEIWLGHRDIEDVRVEYLLMVPPKGTEHLDWMRATRALDIAITTTETRS